MELCCSKSAFLVVQLSLTPIPSANRIPERYAPGTFDYFFASHQIFHVHVLLAALAHHKCVVTAFTYWHSQNPLCMV